MLHETEIHPSEHPDTWPEGIEAMSANEGLEHLVRMNVYLYGHGTAAAEHVDDMLQNGFQLSAPDLHSTALAMPTEADNPDAFTVNMAQLSEWPHRGHKTIVMLGVERLEDEQVPNRRYVQSIVQENPGVERNSYGHRYTIDPRFVAGYFDMAQNSFVPNPNFDPHYDPKLLETTADITILMRRLTTEQVMEGLGGTAMGAIEPQPTVNGENDDDDENVW